MYAAIRDHQLYSCRPSGAVELLKRLGLDAVELAVDREMKVAHFTDVEGNSYSLATEEQLKRLRDDLRADNVRVSALLMHNDFANPDMTAQINWLVKTAQAAHELGARAVRVDFVPHSKMDDDEFLKRGVEITKKALNQTPEDVHFGVENHGLYTNNPEFMEKVLDGVGSERFGVTVDTGNFYWYGVPLSQVYELIERFAPRAVHAHLKNINYPAEERQRQRPHGWEYGRYVSPMAAGDIDHRRVFQILHKAGYTGGLALEDESLGRFPQEKRFEVLKEDVEYVLQCLEGLE